MRPFSTPTGLGNPHLQTIVSSVARKKLLPSRTIKFLDAGHDETFEVHGQNLSATSHRQPDPAAPMVAIIPGWLGSAQSTYVLGLGGALWEAGFSVARLTLRDHGDTAHMNEDMFNSALTSEVVAFVARALEGRERQGLLGFSLGGNFALRVARQLPDLSTLAVCPAIEPAKTMCQIDRNIVYKRYFLNKWRQIWTSKAARYPHRYRASDIWHLNSISTLTEYFVSEQTAFPSLDAYFNAYDLSGDTLDGVCAKILVARDDPIIPFRQFVNLPGSISIDATEQGGHGAYLESWQLHSWLDDYVVDHFTKAFSN
jgi:predicted alpha/beta-fold hydrolase